MDFLLRADGLYFSQADGSDFAAPAASLDNRS
jgi:hypothetical protein